MGNLFSRMCSSCNRENKNGDGSVKRQGEESPLVGYVDHPIAEVKPSPTIGLTSDEPDLIRTHPEVVQKYIYDDQPESKLLITASIESAKAQKWKFVDLTSDSLEEPIFGSLQDEDICVEERGEPLSAPREYIDEDFDPSVCLLGESEKNAPRKDSNDSYKSSTQYFKSTLVQDYEEFTDSVQKVPSKRNSVASDISDFNRPLPTQAEIDLLFPTSVNSSNVTLDNEEPGPDNSVNKSNSQDTPDSFSGMSQGEGNTYCPLNQNGGPLIPDDDDRTHVPNPSPEEPEYDKCPLDLATYSRLKAARNSLVEGCLFSDRMVSEEQEDEDEYDGDESADAGMRQNEYDSPQIDTTRLNIMINSIVEGSLFSDRMTSEEQEVEYDGNESADAGMRQNEYDHPQIDTTRLNTMRNSIVEGSLFSDRMVSEEQEDEDVYDGDESSDAGMRQNEYDPPQIDSTRLSTMRNSIVEGSLFSDRMTSEEQDVEYDGDESADAGMRQNEYDPYQQSPDPTQNEPVPINTGASDYFSSKGCDTQSLEYQVLSDYVFNSEKKTRDSMIIGESLDFGAESGFESETSNSSTKQIEIFKKTWKCLDLDKDEIIVPVYTEADSEITEHFGRSEIIMPAAGELISCLDSDTGVFGQREYESREDSLEKDKKDQVQRKDDFKPSGILQRQSSTRRSKMFSEEVMDVLKSLNSESDGDDMPSMPLTSPSGSSIFSSRSSSPWGSESSDGENKRAYTPRKTFSLRFPQPAADYMTFRDKLECSNVCLENVTLRDHIVLGTVKVKSLGTKRSVFLRCSFDSWRSSVDIPATYTPSSFPNKYETYSFALTMPVSYQDANMILAVCYKTDDAIYWDNNNGMNYEIVSTNTVEREQLSSFQSRCLESVPQPYPGVLKKGANAFESDSTKNPATTIKETRHVRKSALSVNVTKQPTDPITFKSRLERDFVALEHVFNKNFMLTGSIKIKYIKGVRMVFIRCSFDSWLTSMDVPARLTEGPRVPYATYAFEMNVPTVSYIKMQFAVCYEVNGQVYWDNNAGKNYQICFFDMYTKMKVDPWKGTMT